MNLKNFFADMIFRKDDKESLFPDSDPASVCIREGEYRLLAEVETLYGVSSITAGGTWGHNDFVRLKNVLRADLPAYVANMTLKNVDFGKVRLDRSCECLEFKGLFGFCVNLTEVVLPDATSFEGSASFHTTFRGCNKLRVIRNLATYRHISDLCGSFCYCTLLSEVELYSDPLPHGDSDTFQKINRNIRVTVPSGTRIPADWTQLGSENLFFHPVVRSS